MLVSPVFIPPYLHLNLRHMRMAAHLAAGIFLLHAAKKNNNAANFSFVSEAKQFGTLHWRTINYFSFRKRPNISLYFEYSRT